MAKKYRELASTQRFSLFRRRERLKKEGRKEERGGREKIRFK